MSTPARRQEAELVEQTYYWALNQVGTAVAADSLKLYGEQIPADSKAGNNTTWLTLVLRLLFGARREASDLAIAYYRLNRALRTGYAPVVNGEKVGASITVEELRKDFEAIVDHIEAETTRTAGEFVGPAPTRDNLPDEDFPVELENVTDLDALVKASNDSALGEAIGAVDLLGIERMVKAIEQGVDPDAAHASAGAAQASTTERIVMNAARGLVYDLADVDERVIGWVRYSSTGDPCAFCALLISRQVFYKSRRTAVATKRDGKRTINLETGVADRPNQFHENCHCVAVPVFSIEDFDNSPLYEQNRDLSGLWRAEISGKFSGVDALNAWRTLLRNRNIIAAPEAANT